jgi:hypothetical protein
MPSSFSNCLGEVTERIEGPRAGVPVEAARVAAMRER